jgi:FlaA1/EpsC-like NDP-sugar epimerase
VNVFIARFFFNRWAAFVHDLLWVPVAILCSFWLRFNLGEIPEPYFTLAWQLCLLAMPIHSVIFWQFDLYRGVWRFASLPDLIRIVKAVSWGTFFFILLIIALFRLKDVPRSVLFLYPLLLAIGLAGPRLLYRVLKDRRLNFSQGVEKKQRTIILGAGSAGESLVRHLIRHGEYQPIAFLDDDPTKHGREIHGVRVAGGLEEIPACIKNLLIDVVLLAIPTANKSLVQKVIKVCSEAGVTCRTLPSITELGDKPIEADTLRPFTIEDLLGREMVKLDNTAIAGYLKNKNVLVTGGGGSIGSELCRQIARLQPERLIIFEQGEYNLYSIESELRQKFPELNLVCLLGDVKNHQRVDWAFRENQPDVVFHAAAYKHVPMLEKNPAEGVFNNIIGTRIVADAADRFGVKRFVMVSTDKAVNPANVMGATKRVAEIYCQNLAKRSKTRFITTRFGNVLGSTGSVVPLFEQQIKAGGPVTVTHKDITRFFMTIPEAVSLILQAGAMGQGGEIYVLEMGEPVLIRELAEQMIRLSGLQVGKDIEIRYTGLRPGEKLYEEVFHSGECLIPTEHPKLQLAKARDTDWSWLLDELDGLQETALKRDLSQLTAHLRKIVPEFAGGSKQEIKTPIQGKPQLEKVC